MKSLESVSRRQLYDTAPGVTSPKKRDTTSCPLVARGGHGWCQGQSCRVMQIGQEPLGPATTLWGEGPGTAASPGPGLPGSAHGVVGVTCHTAEVGRGEAGLHASTP